MTLQEALDAATPTPNGDRFAIAEPFPDVTFVGAYWARHGKYGQIRVRGHRFENEGHHKIVEQWDVTEPEFMTIEFKPLA